MVSDHHGTTITIRNGMIARTQPRGDDVAQEKWNTGGAGRLPDQRERQRQILFRSFSTFVQGTLHDAADLLHDEECVHSGK